MGRSDLALPVMMGDGSEDIVIRDDSDGGVEQDGCVTVVTGR